MNPTRVKAKNGRTGWRFRYVDTCAPTMGAGGKRKDRRRHKVIWIGERREAEREFAKFLEDASKRKYGAAGSECWEMPFADLCSRFLNEAPGLSEHRRAALSRDLDKFAKAADIVLAGDLRNAGRLNTGIRNLLAQCSVVTVAEKLQGGAKQLTRWAAEAGVLLFDPLASWRRISRAGHVGRKRRAFLPEEMRAILEALAELDALHFRSFSTVPAVKLLLLTGNRPGALLSANVGDIDWGEGETEARIKLPPGRGKKKNGLCVLPDAFLPELRVYLGDRLNDAKAPILVSPKGSRADRDNLAKDFSEAVHLAFVRMEWAEADPVLSGADPYQVAYLIRNNVQRRHDGPRPTDPAKVKAREEAAKRLQAATERLRPAVEARLAGTNLYAIRKTFVSWARRAGVNFDSVRSQVGHAGRDTQERFYLDLVDPGEATEAVLDVLEGRKVFETAAQRRRRKEQERQGANMPAVAVAGGGSETHAHGAIPRHVDSNADFLPVSGNNEPQTVTVGTMEPTKDKGVVLAFLGGLEPPTCGLEIRDMNHVISMPAIGCRIGLPCLGVLLGVVARPGWLIRKGREDTF